MKSVSRRQVLSRSGLMAAMPLTALAAPAENPPQRARQKVLVVGAHPGDPEAGCGGTMARYADLGDEVVAVYLTRGEGGVTGKTAGQAAAIRSAEAEAACRVLKARPVFAGQVDAATEVTRARYEEFARLIAAERPDVVFTHWPVDDHADHRACAALTYGAWVKGGRRFALYFYEVDLGSDTQCFRPSHYVDVTATEPRKRAACLAHASQGPVGGFYTKDHEPMMRFRGMECGHALAEAFVHHDRSPRRVLPE
jgi:LmbE family N-acetylglucosaminyl deacetylase